MQTIKSCCNDELPGDKDPQGAFEPVISYRDVEGESGGGGAYKIIGTGPGIFSHSEQGYKMFQGSFSTVS